MYSTEGIKNINVGASHHYDTYQFLTSEAVHRHRTLGINPARIREKKVWKVLDTHSANMSCHHAEVKHPHLLIDRGDIKKKHPPRNDKLLK